jgi:hypothetical protein
MIYLLSIIILLLLIIVCQLIRVIKNLNVLVKDILLAQGQYAEMQVKTMELIHNKPPPK